MRILYGLLIAILGAMTYSSIVFAAATYDWTHDEGDIYRSSYDSSFYKMQDFDYEKNFYSGEYYQILTGSLYRSSDRQIILDSNNKIEIISHKAEQLAAINTGYAPNHSILYANGKGVATGTRQTNDNKIEGYGADMGFVQRQFSIDLKNSSGSDSSRVYSAPILVDKQVTNISTKYDVTSYSSAGYNLYPRSIQKDEVTTTTTSGYSMVIGNKNVFTTNIGPSVYEVAIGKDGSLYPSLFTPHNGASGSGTNDGNLYRMGIDGDNGIIEHKTLHNTGGSPDGSLDVHVNPYDGSVYYNHIHYSSYPGVSTIQKYDASNKLIHQVNLGSNIISKLAFGKDGNSYAACSDGKIRVYDVNLKLINTVSGLYDGQSYSLASGNLYPVIADIDNDGYDNIIVSNGNTLSISGYDSNTKNYYVQKKIVTDAPIRDFVTSSLNKKGYADLVVITDNGLEIYKSKNSVLSDGTRYREYEKSHLDKKFELNYLQVKNGRIVEGAIDYEKPTYIVTHGWQMTGTYGESMSDMTRLTSGAIAQKLVDLGIDANIVTFDWDSYVGSLGVNESLSRTYIHGVALAEQLKNLFGESELMDRGDFHFIGHSHGSIVNAEAVQFLHKKYGFVADQFTILDAPIVGRIESGGVPETYFQVKLDGAAIYTENFWASTATGFGARLPGIHVDAEISYVPGWIDHSAVWERFYIEHHLNDMTDQYPFISSIATRIDWVVAAQNTNTAYLYEDRIYLNDTTVRNVEGANNSNGAQIDILMDENSSYEFKNYIFVKANSPSAMAIDFEIPYSSFNFGFDFIVSEFGNGDIATLHYNGELVWSFLLDEFFSNTIISPFLSLSKWDINSIDTFLFSIHNYSNEKPSFYAGNFYFVPNNDLATVPEPSTFLLLLFGLLGLLYYSRNRYFV